MKRIVAMVVIAVAAWNSCCGFDVTICVGTRATIIGYKTETVTEGDVTCTTVTPIYEYPLVYSNCDIVVAMKNFKSYCLNEDLTNRVDVMAYNAGSIFDGIARIIRLTPCCSYVDIATGWRASGQVLTNYFVKTITQDNTTYQTVTPLYRDKYMPTTSPVDYSIAITNFYKLFSDYQNRVCIQESFQDSDRVELCELALAQNMESMFKKLTHDSDLSGRTADGIIVVTAEVKGGAFAIPASWPESFPRFSAMFGSDIAKAVKKTSGKMFDNGSEMYVWQDYVAGTDPTQTNDVFKGIVEFVDGKPVVSYRPVLNAVETAKRKYTTLGKKSLMDATDWEVVPEGHEADYNFFKVTVEMR